MFRTLLGPKVGLPIRLIDVVGLIHPSGLPNPAERSLFGRCPQGFPLYAGR